MNKVVRMHLVDASGNFRGACEGSGYVSVQTEKANFAVTSTLIAAAPEMLAELKHLRNLIDGALAAGHAVPGLATLNKTDELIAKAEGKDNG